MVNFVNVLCEFEKKVDSSLSGYKVCNVSRSPLLIMWFGSFISFFFKPSLENMPSIDLRERGRWAGGREREGGREKH